MREHKSDFGRVVGVACNLWQKLSLACSLSLNKDALVADCWCNASHSWNLDLRINLLDNELDNMATILEILHSWAPSNDHNNLKWTLNANGSITTMSNFLKLT